MKRQSQSIVVAAALAAAGGCSSYSDPSLSVAGASVRERTDEALVLSFDISGINPNEVALPLRAVRYDVSLDGKPVFRGVRSAEATLRRKGEQRFTLPAVVRAADLPAASDARFAITGSVEYLTPGELAEVLFDTGLRRPSASFSGAGQVALRR
ncbi:MAG: LEA type 2 family protein [Phycisphaerae bacterium]|nr:LEA type 2 family protein [Phycisphaerae bacterium]